eukprot:gene26631-32181_t
MRVTFSLSKSLGNIQGGLVRTQARLVASRSRVKQGGSSHPAGPYDPPHHPTYPAQGTFLGIHPTEATKSEGWELPTYLFYVGMFAFVYAAISKPDEFKDWARREALAREKVLARGGVVEFGTYYQTRRFYEEMGAAPIEEEEE